MEADLLVDAAGFGYQPGEIPQVGTKGFPGDARLREVAGRCCLRAVSLTHLTLPTTDAGLDSVEVVTLT